MVTEERGWRAVLRSHPFAERSADAQFWDEFLSEHPDVLHRLLADLYRATYGVDRPPSLDDLWALVDAPDFTRESFGDAVRELAARRGHSLRWVAQRAGVDQALLLKYLSGARPVVSLYDVEGSMRRIEAVAVALRVHPSYFAEWRRLWVVRLLDSAFVARPDLSMDVFKRFAGFQTNARSSKEQEA